MNKSRGEIIMKIFAKNSSYVSDYFIEITINTDVEHTNIAASELVKHPKSIKKSARFTDEELRFYNDFIDSMRAPIIHRKFRIKNEYQSKRSYAYYIDFYPRDRNGKEFGELVEIIFRVAEHNIKHGDVDDTSETLIIKSFTLDGVTYPTPYDLQKKIIEICEHLQDGDFGYVSAMRT